MERDSCYDRCLCPRFLLYFYCLVSIIPVQSQFHLKVALVLHSGCCSLGLLIWLKKKEEYKGKRAGELSSFTGVLWDTSSLGFVPITNFHLQQSWEVYIWGLTCYYQNEYYFAKKTTDIVKLILKKSLLLPTLMGLYQCSPLWYRLAPEPSYRVNWPWTKANKTVNPKWPFLFLRWLDYSSTYCSNGELADTGCEDKTKLVHKMRLLQASACKCYYMATQEIKHENMFTLPETGRWK